MPPLPLLPYLPSFFPSDLLCSGTEAADGSTETVHVGLQPGTGHGIQQLTREVPAIGTAGGDPTSVASKVLASAMKTPPQTSWSMVNNKVI